MATQLEQDEELERALPVLGTWERGGGVSRIEGYERADVEVVVGPQTRHERVEDRSLFGRGTAVDVHRAQQDPDHRLDRKVVNHPRHPPTPLSPTDRGRMKAHSRAHGPPAALRARSSPARGATGCNGAQPRGGSSMTIA